LQKQAVAERRQQPLTSEQTPLGKTCRRAPGDDEMVEHLNVDQSECRLSVRVSISSALLGSATPDG